MARFDFFVGKLRCPECGNVSSPDSETGMQTHLRGDQADGQELAAGTRVDPPFADVQEMFNRGYLMAREPAPDESAICLLDFWSCPSCEDYPKWALITFRDGVITEVKAVTRSRESVDQAHFVSAQIYVLIPSLADIKTNNIDEVMRLLKERPGPG